MTVGLGSMDALNFDSRLSDFGDGQATTASSSTSVHRPASASTSTLARQRHNRRFDRPRRVDARGLHGAGDDHESLPGRDRRGEHGRWAGAHPLTRANHWLGRSAWASSGYFGAIKSMQIWSRARRGRSREPARGGALSCLRARRPRRRRQRRCRTRRRRRYRTHRRRRDRFPRRQRCRQRRRQRGRFQRDGAAIPAPAARPIPAPAALPTAVPTALPIAAPTALPIARRRRCRLRRRRHADCGADGATDRRRRRCRTRRRRRCGSGTNSVAGSGTVHVPRLAGAARREARDCARVVLAHQPRPAPAALGAARG